MSGTFSSLSTALSALRYQRVAMDVASGNVANVNTEGYTRRRAEGVSVGAPDVPAMWSRYDGTGDGVRVNGVNRMTDELLNVRARREHAQQGYLDVRQSVLERVESGVGEPGDTGVSASLAALRSAWHELSVNPGSSAARAGVLSAATSAVDALRTQARNVQSEAGDQRLALLAGIGEANSVAQDLADANAAIGSGRLAGDDINVLLDKRDQLTQRLSTLTGATASLRPDGQADVSVAGVSLVSGNKAGTLVVRTGVTPSGGADGQPITFAVTDPSGTTTTLTTPPGGEAGGRADVLATTLPTYLSGLAGVARQLADLTNAGQAAGFDRSGAAGAPVFSYDPADVLGTLRVSLTDTDGLAASSVPGAANLDGGNADAQATGAGVEGDYQRLVTGLGSTVAESRRRAENQQVLTSQVDAARDQLGGVDLDEETVNMLAAQHAYEAASRVMTTLDSILDTLINRTGLTH